MWKINWLLKDCAIIVLIFFPAVAFIAYLFHWDSAIYVLLKIWAYVFIAAVVIGISRGVFEIVADLLRKRNIP